MDNIKTLNEEEKGREDKGEPIDEESGYDKEPCSHQYDTKEDKWGIWHCSKCGRPEPTQ